jgi:hypothetical protein
VEQEYTPKVGFKMWYHASIMIMYSNYIDSMLASGMKESSSTWYKVSFPNIAAPATDLLGNASIMMKFLGKSLCCWAERSLMMVEDVMAVTPWYDQYYFPEDREVCDPSTILAEV